MIDLYASTTQNARKVTIMLEECGLDYKIVPVDLIKGEQKSPKILALNPNGRIPIIVDRDEDDLAVSESGAILLYLAGKTGRFLGEHTAERAAVMQWLFWQMSAVGPVFGNLAHFMAAQAPNSPLVNSYLRHSMASEVVPYSIRRFASEALRLVGVLERQLSRRSFIVGSLSVADFATLAWFDSSWPSLKILDADMVERSPNTVAWMARLKERSAVARGLDCLAYDRDLTAINQKEKAA